jgi:hypothetical protein
MFFGHADLPARVRRPFIFILSCSAMAPAVFAAPLTLDRAWQQAAQADSRLKAVRAELAAAEGS